MKSFSLWTVWRCSVLRSVSCTPRAPANRWWVHGCSVLFYRLGRCLMNDDYVVQCRIIPSPMPAGVVVASSHWNRASRAPRYCSWIKKPSIDVINYREKKRQLKNDNAGFCLLKNKRAFMNVYYDWLRQRRWWCDRLLSVLQWRSRTRRCMTCIRTPCQENALLKWMEHDPSSPPKFLVPETGGELGSCVMGLIIRELLVVPVMTKICCTNANTAGREGCRCATRWQFLATPHGESYCVLCLSLTKCERGLVELCK